VTPGASSTLADQRRAVVRQTSRYLAWALAAVVGTGVLHYLTESGIDRASRESDELLNVSLGQTALVKALEGVQSDLAYLARHNEARGLFRPGDAASERELARDFLSFATEKQIYEQVRFLDTAGTEVVRVNFNAGRPGVVPEAQLQNKADRYYFAEATRLGDGAVYISPLDLNVEAGRVEQPFKPVIRFATRVRDERGGRIGFVLLNYLGQRLLDDFRTATANITDHVMLLNGEGYWLSSPRREDEWGFMSGQERTFATAYPRAWARIAGADGGQVTTPEGMFTFATVHPTGEAAAPGTISKTGVWKVVAHLPTGAVVASPTAFLAHHALVYGTVLVLLAAAAMILARATVMRRVAEVRAQFEQGFRGVLESIDFMALGVDAAGTITFCNQSLLSKLGWRRDALVGHSCFEQLIAPEDRARYEEAFRSLLAGEPATRPNESRVLTRVGGRRLVAWECTPTGPAGGAPAGLVFLGKDITEAREAEERVRMLSRAVEQSPATVMITDPTGAIEYVNPKFTELTGYAFEEVEGRNPRLLKSGTTSPEEYAQLWATINAGGEWRGELQNRKKNGALYWEAATISAVRNLKGEIAHFLAVKEDTTERRRLEERFRHCVESAPCALVLADREGRMVLVNRGTERLFGYQRDELLGESVDRLLPEGARAKHAQHRKDFYAAPGARAMGAGRDLLAMRKNGSTFPVEIGLIPVEDAEENDLVLASLVDISARRRLEHELGERDRSLAQTKALAAVGRMANMVAHDIRNPLSSIKMSLQIFGKQRAAELSEADRELTSIALDQVRYMEEILDDLMSYSRENALAPEWVGIEKLLDAATLLVQRHIDAGKVEVTTRYQPGLPNVYGDPTRLRRAFGNLIVNAVQAMESKTGVRPKISITAQMELAPDRPRVRVNVIDNGCGIPGDLEDRVFEPFYTTRASGTGLGLAIVRRIVDQHNGTVELLPVDGTGTCVSIVLPTGPLAKELHEEPSEAELEPDAAPGVTADDDAPSLVDA
jgi:nitrogen fixation negative regulator NifL